MCEHIEPIELQTRMAVVMHHREQHKATSTGALALACLPNSEQYVHGLQDAPLDLNRLHENGRRVLVLFPAEGARPLSRALKDEDARPITLVVPDGSWRQARRIARRIPGLDRAEPVALPPGPPSRWGVRTENVAAGLATFEAIARALGILESVTVQRRLEALFTRLVEATFAVRGDDHDAALAAAPGTHGACARQPHEELAIVHRDDHLVAINKPSGIVTHRGWASDGTPALQRVRDQLGQFVYPVHRLDRAASGVLLFALNSKVARDVQELFARRDVHKRYLAVCRGHDPGVQRVDHALAAHKGAAKRPATTDFRLLGQFERYGLYEAQPITGRTHQIRRHLKHVSHPIVGDVRYGKGEHNRIFRERFDFRRLALHCHRMVFEHPRGTGMVALEAPLGDDFANLLGQLGLRDAAAA